MSLADLRPALRAFLLADTALSTAVGGARIYPIVLPQAVTEPSLVYNTVSEVNDHHMQGASGLVMQRIQIDAWAREPDDADTIARLAKERLDGFRGTMGGYGSPPVGTPVNVQGVFAETAFTSYEDGSKLYRVSRDFLIWYAER